MTDDKRWDLRHQTALWEDALALPSIAAMNASTILRRNPRPPTPVMVARPEGFSVTPDLDALCVISPPHSLLSPLAYPSASKHTVTGKIDQEGNM
jgi:hypothetical protein